MQRNDHSADLEQPLQRQRTGDCLPEQIFQLPIDWNLTSEFPDMLFVASPAALFEPEALRTDGLPNVGGDMLLSFDVGALSSSSSSSSSSSLSSSSSPRMKRLRPGGLDTRSEPNPKITACPHQLREHYAKGYCYTCYEHYRSTAKDTRTAPNPKISNCPHTTREHHARGMCSSCYEKHRGPQRAKKAARVLDDVNPKITACEHVNKEHQAKGYCFQCYRRVQNQRRRQKNKLICHVPALSVFDSAAMLPKLADHDAVPDRPLILSVPITSVRPFAS